MTRKPPPGEDPHEWLRRARSSLAHARAVSPEVCLEELCFDAQQAAEKAIKAVFVSRSERFPFIHDLEELLRRAERNGLKNQVQQEVLYDFVYVDEDSFGKYRPKSFAALVEAFREYKG